MRRAKLEVAAFLGPCLLAACTRASSSERMAIDTLSFIRARQFASITPAEARRVLESSSTGRTTTQLGGPADLAWESRDRRCHVMYSGPLPSGGRGPQVTTTCDVASREAALALLQRWLAACGTQGPAKLAGRSRGRAVEFERRVTVEPEAWLEGTAYQTGKAWTVVVQITWGQKPLPFH
jgi:hypothetical protein